jgi:hypothetical protein
VRSAARPPDIGARDRALDCAIDNAQSTKGKLSVLRRGDTYWVY